MQIEPLVNFRRLFINFILVCIIIMLLFFRGLNVYVMLNVLNGNDFGKFYYSTIAFKDGKNMYSTNPASLMQINATEKKQLFDLNLPHFHFFILPLTYLPLNLALLGWGIFSVLGLLVSIILIIKELNIKLSFTKCCFGLLVILSSSLTNAMLLTGQVGWFLVLPMTLFWVLARNKNWAWSGIFLGFAISIKPFLGMFLIYLLLKKNWAALKYSIFIIIFIFAVGFAYFGWQSYFNWIQTMLNINNSWGTYNSSFFGFLNRSISTNPSQAYFIDLAWIIKPIWLVFSIAITVITFYLTDTESSKEALDYSFLFIYCCSYLVSPLAQIYYWWLFLGPLVGVSISLLRKKAYRKHGKFSYFLILVALIGMFFPLNTTLTLRSHPLWTVTFGSVYFWSILAMYVFILTNFLINKTPLSSGYMLPTQNGVDAP